MGISLSHARYEEIKQIVVDMFVKYDIAYVPVNGFALATKMGIKIIPYSAFPECILKEGGSIEGKNKNTFVSCWRSSQMCFHAEYAKHIHI